MYCLYIYQIFLLLFLLVTLEILKSPFQISNRLYNEAILIKPREHLSNEDLSRHFAFFFLVLPKRQFSWDDPDV